MSGIPGVSLEQWIDAFTGLAYRYPEPYALLHGFVDQLRLYAGTPSGLRIDYGSQAFDVGQITEPREPFAWLAVEGLKFGFFRSPASGVVNSVAFAEHIAELEHAFASECGSVVRSYAVELRRKLKLLVLDSPNPSSCRDCGVQANSEDLQPLNPLLRDLELLMGEFRSGAGPILWREGRDGGEPCLVAFVQILTSSHGVLHHRCLLTPQQQKWVGVVGEELVGVTSAQAIAAMERPVELRASMQTRIEMGFAGFTDLLVPVDRTIANDGRADLAMAIAKWLTRECEPLVLRIPLHIELIPWASLNIVVDRDSAANAAYFCYREIIPRLFASVRDAILQRYWETVVAGFRTRLADGGTAELEWEALNSAWHDATCVFPFPRFRMDWTHGEGGISLGYRRPIIGMESGNPHFDLDPLVELREGQKAGTYGPRNQLLHELLQRTYETFQAGTQLRGRLEARHRYLHSTHHQLRRLEEFGRFLRRLQRELPEAHRKLEEFQLVTEPLQGGFLYERAVEDALGDSGRPTLKWMDLEKFHDRRDPPRLELAEVFLLPYHGSRIQPAEDALVRQLEIVGLPALRERHAAIVNWYETRSHGKRVHVRPRRNLYHWLFWELIYNAGKYAVPTPPREVRGELEETARIYVSLENVSGAAEMAVVFGNLARESVVVRAAQEGLFALEHMGWTPVPIVETQRHGGLSILPAVLQDLQLGSLWHRVERAGDDLYRVRMGVVLRGLQVTVN